MPATITDNTANVKFQLENGLGLAIRMMLDDVYVSANPNTPQKYGDLRARVIRKMESNTRGAIQWQSNYAEVQEKGYRQTKDGRIIQFRNYTTPGTGPHYAQNAVEQLESLPVYLQKVGLL